MFLLAFKSPSFFLPLTHLHSSLSLFQSSFEGVFQNSHYWHWNSNQMQASLANWNHEGRGREKGLASALKGIKRFSTQAGQVYFKSVTVSNWRGVTFVFGKEVILSIYLLFRRSGREITNDHSKRGKQKIFTANNLLLICRCFIQVKSFHHFFSFFLITKKSLTLTAYCDLNPWPTFF